MKKKRRTKRTYCSNAATTTSKDWGFGPVPCKGGKTNNFEDKKKW
jgi:hypothetical protein